jgi:iron complex outermembrane recepter protein
VKIGFSLIISLLLFFQLQAQSIESPRDNDRVFLLGEIIITGSGILDTLNRVTMQNIEKYNRHDVSTALNTLPGITLANIGPRNESVVYVRGFDLRQVPVFIDGVPVYVPYDGYVDMGRFTTFDIAEINVSKGFSSILYGPNTMGGAINIVSRRPVKKFEISGKTGIFSGNGFLWSLNSGLRYQKFYFQLGASQLKQDYFLMSEDFTPVKNENGNERENSYREDLKFSFKAGFTPNQTDEYVVGYLNQKGEKGSPPYVGNDPEMRARFWQWPAWDKQSLYFISITAINANNTVKTRLYYDTFVNDLISFDDSTYSTMTKPYAFHSFYDDYTIGGYAEFENRSIRDNVLKFGVQYKGDVHRENDLNEPVQLYSDHTISIGIENTYRINPMLSLVPGLSYNLRNSGEAQDYNPESGEISNFPDNENTAWNAQLGLFMDIGESYTGHLTVSRKTRFATLKDRYSFRLGLAIPNPDLDAEVAVIYDAGLSGNPVDKLIFHAGIFLSDLSNVLQQVDNVEPGLYQMQNAGDALFYGMELSLQYDILDGLNAGTNYSWIRRKNQTNPELFFTNVPEHKLMAVVDYSFFDRANLFINAEYNSQRYSTSYGTTADVFTLFNLKASADILRYLSLEGGINNVFDINYSLVEGFPEPGRNFFVNILFRNY